MAGRSQPGRMKPLRSLLPLLYREEIDRIGHQYAISKVCNFRWLKIIRHGPIQLVLMHSTTSPEDGELVVVVGPRHELYITAQPSYPETGHHRHSRRPRTPLLAFLLAHSTSRRIGTLCTIRYPSDWDRQSWRQPPPLARTMQGHLSEFVSRGRPGEEMDTEARRFEVEGSGRSGEGWSC